MLILSVPTVLVALALAFAAGAVASPLAWRYLRRRTKG